MTDTAKRRRYAGIVVVSIALAACGRDPDDALLGTLERDRIELVKRAD